MNIQKLLVSVDKLRAALEDSGKSDTANFYRDLHSRLKTESNIEILKKSLIEIKTSGSIVQYADFNANEEQCWNAMYQESVALLNAL